MGYLIAVDTSLTMGRAPDGGPRKLVDGQLEKSRFEIAADIVESLMQIAARLNQEPIVHLFRLGQTYVSLGEVSSVEDVVDLLTKDDGQDVQMDGCSNFSQFMAFTHDHLGPGIYDKIIILTDCSTFVGDHNYTVGCETRFVIVNSNKDTMSEVQLEELDEIAASSVGYDASPENEMLYHHFFLADFPSTYELASSVFAEVFEMSMYKLEMGHMTTQMRIGHTFYQPGVNTISVLGFLRPTALLNMDTTGTHYCVPVFFEEPLSPTETNSTSRTSSSRASRKKKGMVEELSSEDERELNAKHSSDEYTEIEEEVTDNDEEPVKEVKPRVSFIPLKAMSTPPQPDKKRIDFSGLIASASKITNAELPDFIPPPPPPPVSASAPATPAEPKRKYKIVSRISGHEKEYIPGSGATRQAKIDIPSPAYEPLEEETPPVPKKITPPKKRTKKIKKRVLKKKKETAQERRQRIMRARKERRMAKRRQREQERLLNPPKREEYDRDDVALLIQCKDDGEESESCWSIKEEEYPIADSPKPIRKEVKEEPKEKEEKKDEEKKGEEGKEEEKAEEKKKEVDKTELGDVEMNEEKKDEDKEEKKEEDVEMKEEKKDEEKKEEDEDKEEKKEEEKKEKKGEDVEMKEEKGDEETVKKEEESIDVEMKEDKKEKTEGDDEEKEEGVVDTIPNPFQPSRKRGPRRYEVDDDMTSPFLVQTITEAMRIEDMYAVCLMNNGEYAVLSADQTGDGEEDLLVLSTIVDQAFMPPMIPQFEQLTTHFDETNEVDNLYLTQPVGDNPSYVSYRSNWINDDGIEADMARVRKNLKKLPERLPYFYGDVNRMRNHAYGVCIQEILPVLAEQLIEEAKEFGDLAVKHAEYVATIYRNVIPPAEVKDISLPYIAC